MKRSASLIGLSHDHHHALYTAKVLRDSTDVESASKAFVDFWQSEGERHFVLEEEILLPASGLPGPSSDPDVARMLNDHLHIRRRAASVLGGEATLDDLHELGSMMAEHVRFEERQLFPRIESGLSAEKLEKLGQALRVAETGTSGGD